jgi:hypothetical protein
MKLGHYFLIVWLFSCCFADQAAEPTSYHLNLKRPPPRAGDESAIKFQVFFTNNLTYRTNGKEIATNSSDSFYLQGREKILDWDVSDDSSRVQLKLDSLFETTNGITNELVKPETQLTGAFLLGVPFFSSKGVVLSREAYRQLEKNYDICPHHFNAFLSSKIPQPVFIGQTWKMPVPTNIIAMAALLGVSFTNDTEATGRLIGITNLFGFDSFHLQFHITSTEISKRLRHMAEKHSAKIKSQITVLGDIIVPQDASQAILVHSNYFDFFESSDMVVNGTNSVSVHSRTTIKTISENRPLPH